MSAPFLCGLVILDLSQERIKNLSRLLKLIITGIVFEVKKKIIIMANKIFTEAFIKELEDECNASKRCLERIPEHLFEYKPHPKSMNMGYLALLVAEIPLWISVTIEKGLIDFATFQHAQPTTNQELMEHFENNFEGAIVALQNCTDEELDAPFVLQANGKELLRQSKKESVASTINHWVHHRGQLTVYMRLSDIAVPSIYGPSADEKTF